jgi:hypothetical protein
MAARGMGSGQVGRFYPNGDARRAPLKPGQLIVLP